MKRKKFCYITSKFPEMGYVGYAFVSVENGGQFIHPFEYLRTDYTEFIDDFLIISQNKKAHIIQTIIIYPVRFNRLYELKKEFWDNPTEHYDVVQKIFNLTRPLKNYHFYDLLVTARLQNKKNAFYVEASFKLNTPLEEIESFMLKSDMSVDPRSKYCAFYTYEHPFKLEIETGQVIPIENPVIREETTIKN